MSLWSGRGNASAKKEGRGRPWETDQIQNLISLGEKKRAPKKGPKKGERGKGMHWAGFGIGWGQVPNFPCLGVQPRLHSTGERERWAPRRAAVQAKVNISLSDDEEDEISHGSDRTRILPREKKTITKTPKTQKKTTTSMGLSSPHV
ncbi:hypothetical protein JTE90_000425 [Oedothorax gibbosus]|uniref:Uncharacterized protein n=1 Tax=Oedothorax gibbosus TaxID=931172 RepID=A0AAV6TD00_9ARAC|nr:hypothetical protein JTE90_000425 [Oedothorax gibbosus]